MIDEGVYIDKDENILTEVKSFSLFFCIMFSRFLKSVFKA